MTIILVGGGKTVYFLAMQFISEGHDVTIVTRNEQESLALSRRSKATVINGDGTDAPVLEQAGARRADALIALTPHDQDNLVACQTVKTLYGVPRTIALVNDPENEDVFKRLGISVAFCATRVIASLIEQQTDFEDVVNLLPAAEGRINVVQVILTNEMPSAGKMVAELELPEGSLIAAIFRNGDVLVPRGTTRLELGDHLLMVTTPKTHGKALRTLTGEK